MQLHPRHRDVSLADLDIRNAVVKAVSQYNLTWGELWSILSSIGASWAKECIKDERINHRDS